VIEVCLDRLIDMACINPEEPLFWPDSAPIYLNDVRAEKEKGVTGNSKPYGDTWRHPVAAHEDSQYHIARIIYFMEHPEELPGVEVDNPCFDHGILPGCEIIDGWHRIAAAIILGLPKIKIEYGGRYDVMDYLCGKTDERPDDILF